MTCALYRHFDADGALLYVGISNSVLARTGAHVVGSVWASQIDTIRIEWFDTRDAAVEAETNAIVEESPKFNKMHATTDSGAAITDLINQWPTRLMLADACGASNVAVHRWAKRNSLPAEWQQAVIQACQDRGMDWVTAAWLVAAQARAPEVAS